jgi:hypothetical protein
MSSVLSSLVCSSKSTEFFFSQPTTFDSKQKLTELALKVIRSSMALDTVFNLKLKINLDLLTKSQEFFLELASILIELSIQHSNSKKALDHQALLSSSDFLRLFDTFKDCNITKDELALICIQAINRKGSLIEDGLLLNKALSLRIYNFKNAAIALKNPEKLASNLKQNNLTVPGDQKIKEAGQNFLILSLFNSMQFLQSDPNSKDSEAELQMVANALLPFVSQVAISYLKEKKYPHPENIFTYRNPSGYNSHGIIAAVVMEAALKSLGFQTQYLSRMDLDPRLNETSHAIVLVKIDSQSFIVDTNYIPSIKNIRLCNDATPLPTSTLLVLNAQHVHNFVTSQMKYWHESCKALESMHPQALRNVNEYELSHLLKPPYSTLFERTQNWIKCALTRIWDPTTYEEDRLNCGFNEIFCNRMGETFKKVQFLQLPTCYGYLNQEDIIERIDNLASIFQYSNSSSLRYEIVDLLAKLPLHIRMIKLTSMPHGFLFTDPRLEGFQNISLFSGVNQYYCMLQKMVNVSRIGKTALYPCSGADIVSVLLATDAKKLIFVDQTPLSIENLTKGLEKNRVFYRSGFSGVLFEQFPNYKAYRQRYIGSYSSQNKMHNLAEKLFFEMGQLGVNFDTINLRHNQVLDCIEIKFSWAYKGQGLALRTIQYIHADITDPSKYPPALLHFLKEGIDFFYMKSAFDVPVKYTNFIPFIKTFMNKGSWFMTSSNAIDGNQYDLSTLLSRPKTPIPEIYKKILSLCETQLHPMSTIPSLGMPKEHRSPGTGLSYWHIVHLVRS